MLTDCLKVHAEGSPRPAATKLADMLAALRGEQVKTAFCPDEDELCLVMESGHMLSLLCGDNVFTVRVAGPDQAAGMLKEMRDTITQRLSAIPETP